MFDWLGDSPDDKALSAIGIATVVALGIAMHKGRCVSIDPEGLGMTIDRAGMRGSYPFDLFYRDTNGGLTLVATIAHTDTLYSGQFEKLSPEYCVARGRRK